MVIECRHEFRERNKKKTHYCRCRSFQGALPSILDEIKQEERRFIITKRGEPYADIVPHKTLK